MSCRLPNFYWTDYFNKYIDGTYGIDTYPLNENVYQTAMLGNASVNFIEERLEDQLNNPNTAKPFIAWIGPYAPHTPGINIETLY